MSITCVRSLKTLPVFILCGLQRSGVKLQCFFSGLDNNISYINSINSVHVIIFPVLFECVKLQTIASLWSYMYHYLPCHRQRYWEGSRGECVGKPELSHFIKKGN